MTAVYDAADDARAMPILIKLSAPQNAQIRADYGYSLKAAGAESEALSQFETDWQLDQRPDFA